MQRRLCVVCKELRFSHEMHKFTAIDKKRQEWVNGVRSTSEGRRGLTALLNVHNNPYLCAKHFAPSDFTSTATSVTLRPDAVPFYDDSTATSVTVLPATTTTSLTWSPPPTPNYPSSSLMGILPSPLRRPSSLPQPLRFAPHPLRLPPLIDRVPPPCCRCCCRPETEKEQREDPNWIPEPASTGGSQLSEYLLVSSESFLPLLRKCTSCVGGERNLVVRMHGVAFSCTGECSQCGSPFAWRSSKILPTGTQSNKEQLFKVNLDIVTGSVLSSVGGTKLRQLQVLSGLSPLSGPNFHRLKKLYLAPAVEEFFYRTQATVIEEIKERIAKGERIHLSGDGSFDSRGYSGAWCRYYILCAETGKALHYILMNKSETGGSSMKMEVAALERGLNELSYMIGGTEGIASIVTDRHSSVINLMRTKFPGIAHHFDIWHFIRNITLTLISYCCTAKYCLPVRFWVKPIINRCYDAILTSNGNGELASEKFRAILKCMQGQHKFDKDPSFKILKECPHSAPSNPSIYIPRDGRIVKRLELKVFTEKNIEDIKTVSSNLNTSPCESINALSWRYASKDHYFIRSGHELRTKLAMIHWNNLKEATLNGSRPVVLIKGDPLYLVYFHVGKKSYTNLTHKQKVWRKVRKSADHPWRAEIKRLTYEIRKRMVESPYATEKKRKAAKAKERENWERLTRPSFPSAADANLDEEWSSDEEEDDIVVLPILSPSHQMCSVADAALEELDDEEDEDD